LCKYLNLKLNLRLNEIKSEINYRKNEIKCKTYITTHKVLWIFEMYVSWTVWGNVFFWLCVNVLALQCSVKFGGRVTDWPKFVRSSKVLPKKETLVWGNIFINCL